MTTTNSDQRTRLTYVRDMLQQLKVVSGADNGSHLTYVLEMARLQAIEDLAALDSRPAAGEKRSKG